MRRTVVILGVAFLAMLSIACAGSGSTGSLVINAPASLIATYVSETQVNLSWEKVPFAVNYRIYRYASSYEGPELVRTVDKLLLDSTDDHAFEPGVEYTWGITASNGVAESLITLSEPLTPVPSLDPPNWVDAWVVSEDQVDFEWGTVEDAVEYRLFRFRAGDDTPEWTLTVNSDTDYYSDVFEFDSNVQYRYAVATIVGTHTSDPTYSVWLTPYIRIYALAVAAGNAHSMALDDAGKVWAWGANYVGQLGDGTTFERNNPAIITALPVIHSIATSLETSFAVDTLGNVWAWGSGDYGLLANDTNSGYREIPAVIAGLPPIAQISAGEYHVLALDVFGVVWGWGYNSAGETGGDNWYTPVPDQVAGLPTNIRAISAGGFHSLALDTLGHVWGWGSNNSGELGNVLVASTPTAMENPDLVDINWISAGRMHSLAVDDGGFLFTWGMGGLLGNSPWGVDWSAAVPTPQALQSPDDLIGLSTYYDFSYALQNGGHVWTWGRIEYGSLGTGTTNSETNPVELTGLPPVVSVAAGQYHTLAIDNQGRVWGWGNAGNGRLTSAETGAYALTPILMLWSQPE
ncbi:MAG: hypothetical protein WC712_05740 [Candidatus Brocadiia bacterium]